MKVISKTPVFVVLYILFMIPTYFLPYAGSNSIIVGTAAAEAGDMHLAFWLHLITLLALIRIAWSRGSLIGKGWLVIFPILAAIFDFIPGLSSIPLIPTVMHLLAIILGVIVATESSPVADHMGN